MKTVLFNGHDIILFVIMFICILFSIITLLTQRDTCRAHLWLGLFLLTQAASAAYTLALYGDAFHQWAAQNIPAIFACLELALWLEGPLLLLYTRAALYQRVRFQRDDWLLLFPILIYILTISAVNLIYEAGAGSDFLLFLRSNNVQYYEHLRNLISSSFGVCAYLVVKNYQNKMTDAYSNLDLLSYGWLKLLVAGYIVLKLWSAFYLILFTLVQAAFGESGVHQIDFDLMGGIGNYGHLCLVSLLLYFGLADSRHIVHIAKETLVDIDQARTESRHAYSIEQVERVQYHMVTG